jgi:hypothetical protein
LVGGGRAPARAPAVDATATRVLTKGEPIAAPSGRADDFSWPRGSGANVGAEPAVADPAALAPPTAAAVSPDAPAAAKPPANKPAAPAGQRATDAQGAAPAATNPTGEPKPVQRRPRPNPDVPRPPLPLQGLFRF